MAYENPYILFVYWPVQNPPLINNYRFFYNTMMDINKWCTSHFVGRLVVIANEVQNFRLNSKIPTWIFNGCSCESGCQSVITKWYKRKYMAWTRHICRHRIRTNEIDNYMWVLHRPSRWFMAAKFYRKQQHDIRMFNEYWVNSLHFVNNFYNFYNFHLLEFIGIGRLVAMSYILYFIYVFDESSMR